MTVLLGTKMCFLIVSLLFCVDFGLKAFASPFPDESKASSTNLTSSAVSGSVYVCQNL
jgi:hypothetical protein